MQFVINDKNQLSVQYSEKCIQSIIGTSGGWGAMCPNLAFAVTGLSFVMSWVLYSGRRHSLGVLS